MTTVSIKRHLRELQWRLMLVAAFFIVGACLAYSYQAQLIPLLLNPLGGEKLVYLNPAGGFNFIFLISIYAGMALSFPVLIQQIYAFLRPALPTAAHKKSPVIIISSFVLLVAGVVFGYMIAVPNALAFLYGFADQYVEASLTAESYLNFIIAYTIGIGIVFQVPLLLLLVNSIKPLTPGGLWRSERWVILLSFIVAAIITPTPDPINQAIIAVPVIAVYQIGVVAVLISIARRKNNTKRTVRQEVRSRSQQPVHAFSEPQSTQPVEVPFASILEAHAEMHPHSVRDLDVEMEAALLEKSSEHLRSVELQFEEELDTQNRPIVQLSEAEETELEQALVAAAETDSEETADQLVTILQSETVSKEIVQEGIAQDFTPIIEAELAAELQAEQPTNQAQPAIEAPQLAQPAQPRLRHIDGFAAPLPRGANSPAQIRKRVISDARIKSSTPASGMYIDGIVSSRSAPA